MLSFLTNVITGLVALLRGLLQAIVIAIVQSRIVERLCNWLVDYSDNVTCVSMHVVNLVFPTKPDTSSDADHIADI